jgi:DNA polymerase III delta subunit
VLVDDAARGFVADAAADAEIVVVRPPSDSLMAVRSAVEQIGLFASSRAIWIRGLRNEPQDQIDDLLDLLDAGLPPDNVMVATADSLDQRGRLFKWFKSNDAVVDCRLEKDRSGRLLESAVGEFVAARLRANGVKSPTRSSVHAIVERSGNDIGELAGEIDKLCLAAADGGPDERLVREQMRDLGEVWVFALTDALSARDLGKAHLLLERLLRQGEPVLRLVAVLGTHFAQLTDAHGELERVPPAMLRGNSLDKRSYDLLSEDFRARYRSPYRAYHLLRGASAYRGEELLGLHRRLVDIDMALKSSTLGPADMLSGFLVQACAPSA